MTTPRFASVILDVDSTLCGIEGIDWLAQQRGGSLAAELAELTVTAMAGTLPLEQIYGDRLARIKPTAAELKALGEAYRAHVAPGARETIQSLRDGGVEVHLVSGGIFRAILPVSADLGFRPDEVHAVTVTLDAEGRYLDYNRASPLATALGKGEVVAALGLPRPQLALGDGMTDAVLRDVADQFVAFTGFVRRPNVVVLANSECSSFADLLQMVLP